MADCVSLTENDIPGASLEGRSPSELKNSDLIFWLKCRGDSCKGLNVKAQLVKRVEEYITSGRDKCIVDPDANKIYSKRKARECSNAHQIKANDTQHRNPKFSVVVFLEWNGMEWNGMKWNGMEWNGMEWNGMEWNGMEWNGMEWNGMEWNGMEWNGMEWNGMKWLE
ncbi:hypothetical protein QZH41_020661 [Actinostola sp. cb2023]|nr:hypothetical protein QZH41_020661 [Actinostola sp. cb2023]